MSNNNKTAMRELLRSAKLASPGAQRFILSDVEEISVKVVVDPDYAKKLLGCNHGNRKVVRTYVDQLAREMAEGRWEDNGQTMSVSDAGRLVDGQNRLMAVVQSGVTIQAYIVFGVSDRHKVRATVDQGKSRTVANILQIAGEDVDPVADRIASLLAAVTPGQPGRMVRTQKAEFLKEHLDEIAPWTEWAEHISRLSPVIEKHRRRNRSIGASAAGVLAIHMARHGADLDVFQEFMDGAVQDLSMAELRGLTQNRLDILQALNRRLRNGAMLGRPAGGMGLYSVLLEMDLFIRTYNRYLINDKVIQLKALSAGDLRYLDDLPMPLLGGKR